MKKVDEKIAAQLWAGVEGEFALAVALFVERGAMRQKGKTAKQVKIEALIEIAKLAYVSGLDRGYDMAAHVFGGDE